jgi:hypothetical protein
MKLIKLNDTYAGIILVNPDSINLVKKGLEKKLTLYMRDGEVHEIMESEAELLSIISEDKKR